MMLKSTRLVMHSCLIMMVGNYQKIFAKFSVRNICRGGGKGIHKNNSKIVFYTLKPGGVFMSI